MQDQFESIWLVVAYVAVTIVIVVKLWHRHVARNAERWPSVEGVIESGQMEAAASGGSKPKVVLPVFAFSYEVTGEYYGGRFALLPYVTDLGESIIERMIGRKLQIHYDPKKPETWFIADKLIEGCKVEQKFTPDWFSFPPPN